ncbi:hypothetical protein Ahy_A07g031954 [Arachis hypogaea]|uniref:DUF4283 domain-containing protein n=1 Tax=Arachis hypogaea TaxID=3818 RepID=A0A445C5J8_ARAHY|nr:hypothetical protein Ahy_A07g031954 [Arachis hypogaea]
METESVVGITEGNKKGDSREEESEDEEDEEDVKIQKMPNGLMNLIIGERTKRELRKVWWDSLVVKLLGRKISLLALRRRLEIMWGKSGSLDVIDLGNDFFLIGNIVGRTLKVDYTTVEVSRGKFARLCVEVNLQKLLVS